MSTNFCLNEGYISQRLIDYYESGTGRRGLADHRGDGRRSPGQAALPGASLAASAAGMPVT